MIRVSIDSIGVDSCGRIFLEILGQKTSGKKSSTWLRLTLFKKKSGRYVIPYGTILALKALRLAHMPPESASKPEQLYSYYAKAAHKNLCSFTDERSFFEAMQRGDYEKAEAYG